MKYFVAKTGEPAYYLHPSVVAQCREVPYTYIHSYIHTYIHTYTIVVVVVVVVVVEIRFHMHTCSIHTNLRILNMQVNYDRTFIRMYVCTVCMYVCVLLGFGVASDVG